MWPKNIPPPDPLRSLRCARRFKSATSEWRRVNRVAGEAPTEPARPESHHSSRGGGENGPGTVQLNKNHRCHQNSSVGREWLKCAKPPSADRMRARHGHVLTTLTRSAERSSKRTKLPLTGPIA